MKNEGMKKLWGSFALEYYNFSRINPNMCRAACPQAAVKLCDKLTAG